jgi:hypothetical protein
MAENKLHMRKIRAELFPALILAFSLINAFAQEEPERIAVYVHGAEAGINKSFGNKLLLALAQSGEYAEIGDSEAFHAELAKNGATSTSQIAQAAKRHGADIACVVSMVEAFGAYSITVRMIDTDDSEILQTASLDRSLKSLDDLARASNDIAAQLLGLAPPAAALPAAAPLAAASQAPAPAASKECSEKYNINEVVSKIQSGFPKQLKDCSVTLAKNMALAMSPFGKKTPMKDPATFMKECTIDGIKQKLPAGAGEYVKPIESFIQNLLGAAMAGSSLDVKKLSGAIGGMNVNSLISELKAKAANDPCIVNEPYEPADDDGGDGEEDEPYGGKRKVVSLGLRIGFNFSHLVAEYSGFNYNNYGSYNRSTSGSYDYTPGFQTGLVLDIAPSRWFHIQPGLMYIQKGAEDKAGDVLTLHYVELPFLFSLKLSALRLNAGPYVGLCLDGGDCDGSAGDVEFDVGLSTGLGFDIGMFYIGAFYEYGFFDVSNRRNYEFYNRTLGFNLGINL